MSHAKAVILLVDDDPAILLTVGDQLESEGYEVIKAASTPQALQALSILKESPPDLIVLDICMPGVSGLSFLREIAGEDGRPRLPVLIFTARAEMNEFFAQVEVDGFLAKTADPGALLREIDRILAKRAAERPSRCLSETRRLIVADDDEAAGRRLAHRFREAGYEVQTVPDGYALVERAMLDRPDLAVVKAALPRVSGRAAADMLNSLPTTRGMAVVVYGAEGHHPPGSPLPPGVAALVPTNGSEEVLRAVLTVRGP